MLMLLFKCLNFLFLFSQEEMSALAGETKEGSPSTNGDGEGSVPPEQSELSDTSEGTSETASAGGRRTSKSNLRAKAHAQSHSKEREAARQKQASQKQAIAEHRRLEEEVGKLDRRLEGIEREFRKLLGAIRVKALGKDRFHNRYWWFDGMGSASLVGSGGIALYGTGRLFIQGPSEFDLQQLEKRAKEENEDLSSRKIEEEDEDGIFGSGGWGIYTEIEEVGFFFKSPVDVELNVLTVG